jgi:hypothetical protein
MAATLERHGLGLAYERHAPIWQVAGHERGRSEPLER